MENMSFEIEKVRNMTSDQLKKYAETKSTEILALIKQSCNKVGSAKRNSEDARNMKIRWWQRSKAKTDAVAGALLKTNEAVAELAELQKYTIAFICVSVEFASVMHQTMARMMTEGFKDANGNIQALDKDAQEFAQHILDEAEAFTRNQKAVEQNIAKQAKAITEVAKIAEDNRRCIEEKEAIDSKQDQNIAENRKSIKANYEAISSNRNHILALKATAAISMVISIVAVVLSVIAIVVAFMKS